MPGDPVKPSGANSEPPPATPPSPKALSAMSVAANTAVVGIPSAALIVWALETYWKPGGAPLPDWVAAAVGTAVASAATYVYHVGSALVQKWVNAKLDEP